MPALDVSIDLGGLGSFLRHFLVVVDKTMHPLHDNQLPPEPVLASTVYLLLSADLARSTVATMSSRLG